MKIHLKNILKAGTIGMVTVMLLLWAGTSVILSSCKKTDRLFNHVDSIGEVPSQFHFFNSLSYTSALLFSVDGLSRETVKRFDFSKYYPSSSAFNTNNGQPNSKLLSINDPANQTLFASLPNNSTFQFKPHTSYIVFSTSNSYDTISTPLKSIVPRLVYYPEDVYHPFDKTTSIRVFNCIAGFSDIRLNVSPNIGQGTVNTLKPVYTDIQPVRASDSYATTQPGQKTITLTILSNPIVQLNYLPVLLDNSRCYSFFAVGDVKNFLAGIQPRPRLFLAEDGNPANVKELTLSSIAYPGNLSTTAQVTVINGAYNIAGQLNFGIPNTTEYTQYNGLDVQLNQSIINVSRWPITSQIGGTVLVEDIGGLLTMGTPAYPSNLMQRINTKTDLTPGPYKVTVVPGKAFSPAYGSFNYNFEQGLAYTLCLLPDANSSKNCGALFLQNDNSPDIKFFKLRIINIMGGAQQIDVHLGSPGGPIIASAVSYGQQNDYISLKPDLLGQNLFITTAGSIIPLFQKGTNSNAITLPFTSGNSGTLFIMGLLPGTPYHGDSGSFGPYVYYNSDAHINDNNFLPSMQLYF